MNITPNKPAGLTLTEEKKEEIIITADNTPTGEKTEDIKTTDVAPTTVTPAPTETPSIETKKVDEVILKGDLNPSNWSIFPLEDDQIEATNSTTQKYFKGTVLEFNEKYLRGK